MSGNGIFESERTAPDAELARRERTLLGFEARYGRIRDHLRLLLGSSELAGWSNANHGRRLAVCDLLADQYPLIVFHGDVGTGKTATAECVANRLMTEAGEEDSVLFRLSNRVRGSGRVGEMGTLLAEAFRKVAEAAGRSRRAVLIIDEGDSIAASRAQEHSHHEDKVAVNSLIQGVDDLRRFGGRVAVFLCTNRLSALDPALVRRAAITEEFTRPDEAERTQLLTTDLGDLGLGPDQILRLVMASGPRDGAPGWTYSDFRTRFYPAAVARAFPREPLRFDHLLQAALATPASRVMEDR